MKKLPSLFHGVSMSSCWACVVLLLSACSEASEYVEPDTDQPTQRQPVIVTDENGNTSSMTEGSTIGIYTMGEDGGITLQQFVVGGDGTAVLPTTSLQSTIIAYSPYQSDWGSDIFEEYPVFTVQSNQRTQEQYEASDLMIAVVKTSETTDTEGYCFRHMLSKVAIHVIDDTGSLQLDQISVKLHHVNNSVLTDLAHQSVTTIGDSFSDILMLSKVTTDWRLSSYAIVPPQSVAEGTTFFTVMLSGDSYTYPIPQSVTMEGGKTYTFNARLTLEGLQQEGWFITDWNQTEEREINI